MSQNTLINAIQSILWMAVKYAQTDTASQPIIQQAISDLKRLKYPIVVADHYTYIGGARIGLSHEQRSDRRKEIARYHAEHPDSSLPEVADLFNVGLATVTNAIKEHQSTIFIHATKPTSDEQLYFWWYNCYNLPERTIDVINDLIHNHSMMDIATKYGISRQRVHQIKMAAVLKGVKFTEAPKEEAVQLCVICGVSHNRNGQTCGPECFRVLIKQTRMAMAQATDAKWSRLISKTYQCLSCGTDFSRTNYQVSISEANGCSSPKYCSQKCYYNRTKANNLSQVSVSIDDAPFTIYCIMCDQIFDDHNDQQICPDCIFSLV